MVVVWNVVVAWNVVGVADFVVVVLVALTVVVEESIVRFSLSVIFEMLLNLFFTFNDKFY